MIDLLEYGFKKNRTTAEETEYEGYGFRVSVFEYLFKQFNGSEVIHRSFMVNTKSRTSVHEIDELEGWLEKNRIERKVK